MSHMASTKICNFQDRKLSLAVALNWGKFVHSRGDLWQCVETLLVVTVVGEVELVSLLASSGQRLGTLLNILHCTGQFSTMGVIWPQMSAMLRLMETALSTPQSLEHRGLKYHFLTSP